MLERKKELQIHGSQKRKTINSASRRPAYLMEQPSKIIPSLPTQGSIKNVSEKETFSSRSPLTLKMQHTLNFVGRPQYGLIPQSRVP